MLRLLTNQIKDTFPNQSGLPTQTFPHLIRIAQNLPLIWGPFLESPGNFSGLYSHSKISNLTLAELLYSRFSNMKRRSLHTRSFRRVYFSVFTLRWTKNGFTGPKSFRGFRETGPWSWLAGVFQRPDTETKITSFTHVCSRSAFICWKGQHYNILSPLHQIKANCKQTVHLVFDLLQNSPANKKWIWWFWDFPYKNEL